MFIDFSLKVINPSFKAFLTACHMSDYMFSKVFKFVYTLFK